MTKALAVSAFILAATAAVASGQPAPAAGPVASSGGGDSPVAGSVGVGVEYALASSPVLGSASLGEAGGISVLYDAGLFHVGGYFSYYDPQGDDNSAFGIGGEFYYHIHHTSMADFSVGGSLGIISVETGPNMSITPIILEPGFQLRWFATSNLAISFTGGISVGLTNDDKNFGVGGLDGIAGVHYYFTK